MTVLSRLLGAALRTYNKVPLPTSTSHFRAQVRGFKRAKLAKDSSVTITPKVEFETPNIRRMGHSLMKCSIFAAAFCTTTYTGAVIWEYERARNRLKNPFQAFTKFNWNAMEGWRNKEGELRQTLNKWWNDLSDGQRVFWPIFFLNAAVYALWQVPALKLAMFRYFAFSPAAHAVCLPMILSTFSHYNLFHLGANMYVLHSFSTPICSKLGMEQFLGLYLCSGVLSSLAGAAFKVLIRSSVPSIGASGAIMGMLGYFCSKYPDSRLGIIFIPNFNFSAEQGLMGIMCLDTTGLILRWRLFDHAAHLSGAISGIMYAKYGQQLWEKRRPISHKWHELRETFTPTKSR
ncbi:presenilins-associated rhomboid-like protein, mitochondrial [Hyalella azteca]|uniref:rhomboid protease n=1 Tax=Hyalella azteca TaxID=294128 RepID=A0A8B7NJ18_HYAAZ|nr:presenilins-associated rhomboid-like protein, mitochondrial [Hyalella azteca]